ncbi:MAG: hypothetical protein RBU30_08120 [Polyangia bacterium]|jgi:hypothetical protein|nr:hypothetical protein [Polyangia bacterium]
MVALLKVMFGVVLAFLSAGSLGACAAASGEGSPRRPSGHGAAGHVSGSGRSSGPARAGAAPQPSDQPSGSYHLSLDLHRDEGCGETFVGVRSGGTLKVEVSRFGQSSLTVELTAVERSAPRSRPSKGGAGVSTRSWKRSYRWAGRAGFMGPSAQLHLKPVGAGCAHQDLHGIRGVGCRGTLPGLVVECNPARLADSPVQIKRKAPGADRPTHGHARCSVEVSGPRDKVFLPPDLRFLSRPLLLTRDGRPELVLRLVEEWNLVEGELRSPRPRPSPRP